MRRICTICARGGSKGVKGKNLKSLNGKPLIAYSIEHAVSAGIFDVISVSSDSNEILEIAKKFGVDVCIRRPEELSSDESGKLPAIRHCVEETEKIFNTKFDTCVDLDCTSPLREVLDIKNVVNLLEGSDIENVITGMPSRRSPYFNLVEETESGIVRLSKTLKNQVLRRQDAPASYDMNASIYAWRRNALHENDTLFLSSTKIYVMPEKRSIDIDSEEDFQYVEYLMRKKSES